MTAPATVSPPARLGRYDFARCGRKLGEGGMGQVWLAYDEVLQIERAVKLPSEQFALDPDWRLDMVREARALANLQHRAIARFYEFIDDGQRCGLVMEYVRGETLRVILETRGPLSVSEALRVGREVAEALDEAHHSAMRIVHCDLKPANIMLTEDGGVKILDWGIARREAHDGDDGPARFGTAGYVPPERILGSESPSRATDIFAFGCVLFECLTGIRAFPGTTVDEKIERTLHGEPDWAMLPREVPPHVAALLKHLLQRDSRLRLQDVRDAIPLLTLDSPRRDGRGHVPNNLPALGAGFVGRERDLADARAALGRHRLVVIQGLGGLGKSALAIQLAHELANDRLFAASGLFRDGVWLVRLGLLKDPALLPETIANALPSADVGSGSDLCRRLADSAMLLILDRCEHLAQDVARLADELLQACPQVRILASSRTPIPSREAATLHLRPLSYVRPSASPTVVGELRALDSVRLFVECARQANREFAPDDDDYARIADICARLDGIPLLIRQVAGFVSRWELDELLDGLDGLLSRRGEQDAESVVESIVAWSLERLEPAPRELLRRLTIFAGGWTMKAARAVCSDESGGELAPDRIHHLLGELVERSLVEFERPDGAARYRMLAPVRRMIETVLEPAASPASRAELRARHREWCFALPAEAAASPAARQNLLHGRLDPIVREWGNVRAAIQGAIEDGLIATAADIALQLHRFWYSRGLHREGLGILETIAGRLAAAPPPPEERAAWTLTRARLHNAAGIQAWQAVELDRAERHYALALELLEEFGTEQAERAARVRNNLGLVEKDRAAHAAAISCFDDAARMGAELGNPAIVAEAQLNKAVMLEETDHVDEAAQLLECCLDVLQRLPDHEEFLGEGLYVRGRIGIERGDLASAGRDLSRSLRIARDLGNVAKFPLVAHAAVRLAERRGRFEDAAVLMAAATCHARGMGLEFPSAVGSNQMPLQERLRQELGAASFVAAWRRGEGLPTPALLELVERVCQMSDGAGSRT